MRKQMKETKFRIHLVGARGRMGTRIAAIAGQDARVAGVVPWPRDQPIGAAVRDPAQPDVVIDFSSPGGVETSASLSEHLGAALLVGTTGLGEAALRRVERAAERVPVMVAPNTSRGVALLAHLAGELARLLPETFGIEIVESHHRGKRDAPSGTALRLAEKIRGAGRTDLDASRVHSIRIGDIVGEHEIIAAGDGQVLRLSHRAESRDVFAQGAVDAAAWLCRQRPGRYTIDEAMAAG